jgi:CheY-like chemotaxis protein
VDGDSARLAQILENLLANASKYTPPRGSIRLSLAQQDGHAALSVQDNGEGIPPDMLDKIFEPFVQAHQTLERSDGGIGVGLTMAKTIAELHQGTISVSSDGEQSGSRFEVRIPTTPKRPPKSASNHSPPPKENNLKILIVEDNADSREMLGTLLRLEGYTVCLAADGLQGLEAIRTEKPDVALVDIGLPCIDGYELARRVRQEPPEHTIRLVALSGYGRTEDRNAALEAGFNDHLVKPVQPSELARVLKKPQN